MNANAAVRKSIAAFTELDEVRRELEEILGIADDTPIGASIAPTAALNRMNGRRADVGMSAAAVGAGVKITPPSDPMLRRPKESTAPPALRNLAATESKPAPRQRSAAQRVGPPQAHNEARKQPCGTEAAARRHVFKGEPVCGVCLAGRDARNQVKNGVAIRRPRKATAKCGSGGGYSRHKREKTPVCDACREVRNAGARRLAAKKREAKS